MNRERVALLISLLAFSTILAPPTASAKPVWPKVGACYLYPEADMQAPRSASKDINCAMTHNAETYRVVTSPFKSDPSLDPPISLSIRVAPICQARFSSSKYFTGWSFKLPTKSQWKAGARWLRCDAFVLRTESETATFQEWKGKKLDIK